MTTSGFRALLAKELRQLTRSRSALASATLLPIFMLVLLPLFQMFSMMAAANAPRRVLASPQPFPTPPAIISGVGDFARPLDLFAYFLFPLFVLIAGLMMPSVAATYAVVAERERRSLELLVCLPVRVRDILLAKLAAILLLGGGVTIPLYAITASVVLRSHAASPLQVGLTFLLLLAGLLCSICLALLLTLLARDFRTARQLTGVLYGPLVFVCLGVLAAVPGPARYLAVAGLLVVVGALAVAAGLRWVTFERYLS